jgi:hypothetical protein
MTSTKSLFTALAVTLVFSAVCGAADAASIASGKKLEVNVDPEKVNEETKALWGRFGGWCAIAEWHPAVKSCEETKDGDDVYRTLTLQDGATIKEKLLDTSAISYRYAIIESPLPVKNYEAQFSIVPDDDDLDEVNIVWAATYDAADGKDDKEARKTIDGIFKDGIDNIDKMLGQKDGDDDKPKDKD